jgi:hypothetical protein
MSLFQSSIVEKYLKTQNKEKIAKREQKLLLSRK